jgi:HAD superfamily hydrolase (TIGR01509 family)
MPENNWLQAILFDLDGTLINSLPAYILSFQENIRATTGRMVSAEELRGRISIPTPQILAFYAAPQQIPAMIEHHNELMRLHADRIAFYPGVRAALASLHAAGLKLAVVTSQIAGELATTRAVLGLDECIDTWIHSDLVAHPKPAADPVLLALEQLGVQPGNALMVGDSIYDLRAGQAAGTRTAAVTWGFSNLPDLMACSPDLILNQPDELAQLPQRMASRPA